jgi:hypothetical protein
MLKRRVLRPKEVNELSMRLPSGKAYGMDGIDWTRRRGTGASWRNWGRFYFSLLLLEQSLIPIRA